MKAYDAVLNASLRAAEEAMGKVYSGEIKSLAGVEDYVETRMGSILDTFMPSIKEEAAAFLAPAAQQTVDAIKPAMYEVLRDWTPSFASIVGGMAGLAVLLGVWVSKQTFVRTRRNPRRRAS